MQKVKFSENLNLKEDWYWVEYETGDKGCEFYDEEKGFMHFDRISHIILEQAPQPQFDSSGASVGNPEALPMD